MRNPGLEELVEWLEGLGLAPAAGDQDLPLQKRLRDGIFLCQLVNRVRPGAVEEVSDSISQSKQGLCNVHTHLPH